jgi:hypothetical protein
MAGNASVLEDSSILSRLDQNLLKIEKAFALISGLAIFSLMVLAVRSVGGREFFEEPLSGYVDWIMQLMPLIAILAVSFAMRDGRISIAHLTGMPHYSVVIAQLILDSQFGRPKYWCPLVFQYCA